MHKLDYPAVSWKIRLPADTAGRVELRLVNVKGTGPAYGQRGKLINALLRLWLDHEDEIADLLRRIENREASAP